MAARRFVPTQPPVRQQTNRTLPQRLPARKIVSQSAGRRDLSGIEIAIPEKPSLMSNNPLDFITLIYGPKKIGKTDLASQFGMNEGTTFFMMFEKEARHLSIRQSMMKDQVDNKTGELQASAWIVAEAYLDHLIRNKDTLGIRTLCPDGLGAMYDKALVQACKEGGFAHPGGQDDYGKSWDKVKRVFLRFTDRLIDSGYGVVFTTHDIYLNHETSEGVKTQIVPNLPRQAEEFIRLKIDNVFYYHFRNRDRWLQLRGDELVYAGCAPQQNFLTPNGEPIWMVPMGRNAKQAFQNFMNAFNNKQKSTYEEVTKQDLTELKKQRGDTVIRKTKEKTGGRK